MRNVILILMLLSLSACVNNDKGVAAPSVEFCPEENWKKINHVHTSIEKESTLMIITLCVISIESVKNPWREN